MRTFSSLLVVTFMAQEGLDKSGIVRPLSLCVYPAWNVPFGRAALNLFANWNPSGPNLLDEPLNDFIVNPADLPW